MTKTTHILLTALVTLIFSGVAHAANWQTPSGIKIAASDSTISTMPQKFFQVTNDDVAAAVAKQMQDEGFRQSVTATVNPGIGPVIHSADHPLKLAIHGLQVDPDAKLWQAQAYVISGNTTETVKPVAGRFDATMQVPVLTRQLQSGDVIEKTDLELRPVPERQLRKDTVTDMSSLLGQSPRRIISPNRPIRLSEVSQPVVIKKGQAVEMLYTTPYMHIRATGEALENGATGALIRVKNSKSEKAVSGRVVSAGVVELNNESEL